MNILVAASTFPRWPKDEVPDFVWQQVRFLKHEYPELNIHVLAPHDKHAKANEFWENISIHRFQYCCPATLQRLVYPAIWPNIRRNPLLIFQVPLLLLCEFIATCQLIRSHKIDLVYSHWFVPQGVACGLAAILMRVPHVITSHSSDVQVMWKLPVIGKLLVRFFVRRSKALTVVSKRSLEKLLAFFSTAEWQHIRRKVKVIPMGVDTSSWSASKWSASECKYSLDMAGKTLLLFIGRLAEKKGVEYLLDALCRPALLDRQDLMLVIAGTGPQLQSLKIHASRLKIDERVRFDGFVQGDDKLRLFAAADVLIVPSIITDSGDAEGFPVALMESLVAGKICIATDASGADDALIDGKNGFLVPQKDSRALEEAICKALALSEKQKECMQDAAVRSSRQFDWKQIVSDHYEHLLR